MDNSTTNDSGGDMGANNDSMTMMGKTLQEAQHPINSTVMPRHSCDRTLECAEHVQGRTDSRWPERWRDTNWTYWGLASADGRGPGDRGRKRWCWTGHILRKEVNNDRAVALGWKPEGKRNRGRPKTTWRCTVEKGRDGQGWTTWAIARQAANNHQQWREDVRALCASWREEI